MTVTPKVFYTLDLRRVLKHLATGGAYETIPPPPVVPNIEVTTPSANVRKVKHGIGLKLCPNIQGDTSRQ